jgi:hypothetical protein
MMSETAESVANMEVTSDVQGNLELVDTLIFPIGYESRSTHVARRCAAPNLEAVSFTTRQIMGYQRNIQWARDAEATVHYVEDEAFESWASEFPDRLSQSRHVGLDISSFSRDRIGPLLKACVEWVRNDEARRLDVFYAPSKYSKVNAQEELAQSWVGSAELVPGFEGDLVDPDLSLTTVIGLGYDPGRAMGAIELLEAPLVTCFLPTGVQADHDAAVAAANAALATSPWRVSTLTYDVLNPLALFDELVRVIAGLQRTGRAVIVPFGPKIFAAAACLAALWSAPRPPIWRVSGGKYDAPIDVAAAGPICGLGLRHESHIPAFPSALERT